MNKEKESAIVLSDFFTNLVDINFDPYGSLSDTISRSFKELYINNNFEEFKSILDNYVTPPVVLTKEEAIFAAENNLPVRLIIEYFNPSDENVDMVYLFEKINEKCYYIGETDIDFDTFDEEMYEEFDEGELKICRANKEIKYK